MNELLIISPFNITFFILFVIFTVLFILLRGFVLKRGEKCAKTAVVSMAALTLVLYIIYKFGLTRDAAYSDILVNAGKHPFNVWNELPFHLCNINIILVPVSALTGRRSLKGFAFFVAPLGAMIALAMPVVGFSGYSLLLPRIFGYYVTHFLIIFLGLSQYAFGLYEPHIKDVFGMSAALVVFSFSAFIINVVFRSTGISLDANYFYTYDPSDNPILMMLYRFIPIRYVYVLPCILILAVYVLLIFAILRLQKKIGKGRRIEPAQEKQK